MDGDAPITLNPGSLSYFEDYCAYLKSHNMMLTITAMICIFAPTLLITTVSNGAVSLPLSTQGNANATGREVKDTEYTEYSSINLNLVATNF